MIKTKPLLYQNDPKWMNVKLGNSAETIGGWGSLLTCITMMLNEVGYNETPDTVNKKLIKAGGFLKALPVLPFVAYVWPYCTYLGITRCERSDAPLAQIDREVAAGKPVILQVDSGKRRGIQTHFVLVKQKKGDDYVVYDPYRDDRDRSNGEILLTERYNHNRGKLEAEISAVLWFDFDKARLPEPDVKPMPSTAEKDTYIVYAAEERLVLRADASEHSYPWKCLFLGTELTSLEPSTARVKVGQKGQWISVRDPEGDWGFVSAPFVTSALSTLLPSSDRLPKKWCLKNVAIQQPVIEMRPYYDGTEPDKVAPPGSKPVEIAPGTKPVKSFDTLPQNTVVSVLKADKTMPGFVNVMYQETYLDSGVNGWVTVRVMGWVNEMDLDDYCEDEREEFRNPVPGVITNGNQTESSTDGQQDFYLDGDRSKPRYNMCGEISVAFLTGKKIDTVLSDWKANEKYKGTYYSMVGNVDKPLGPSDIENLLTMQIGERETTWMPYQVATTEQGKPVVKKIPFAATYKQSIDGKDVTVTDNRRASDGLANQLKEYYFIANVRIDTNTGDLQSASSGQPNHWVVLDRVTRNGSRVEIYNPFPNRREEYTFGELYQSIGGDPRVGWWIKRDNPKVIGQQTSRTQANRLLPAEDVIQPPTFQVAIDNQTANPIDAQQYLYIKGEGSSAKTKLCGEFCMTFILGQSFETALAHWQDGLKQNNTQVDMRELATLLQAYGFNQRKYIRPKQAKDMDPDKYYVVPNVQPDISPDGKQYFKSFSIDTVLAYWKGVQPDLYNSILGGTTNQPTGPDDLKTILKAYGYSAEKEDYSYYRPGSQEPFGYAPGRDAEMLKTHFVLAGVNINGTTGRLQPSGVGHWVVITKITPRGNLVGGNGGWVELYNPFPNCWEEYSYREFMNAFQGTGEGSTLWIKKDVSPLFVPQNPVAAKLKGNQKSSSSQKSAQKSKNDGDKDKKKKKPQSQIVDDQPPLDANQLVCERLDVEAIPWEIGKWIGKTAAGDPFFAQQLTDILLESGILSIHQEGDGTKKTCTAVLTDPQFSDGVKAAIQKSIDSLASSQDNPVFKVASMVLPLLTAGTIEGIKTIQKDTPVHAYQRLEAFRGWTRGLAYKTLDPAEVKIPLEVEIKNRLERLSASEKDTPDEPPLQVCRTILTRFNSPAFEQEILNIYSARKAEIAKICKFETKEDTSDSFKFFREWVYGRAQQWERSRTSEPQKKMYRVKRWADPGMTELGFNINLKKNLGSNFQAVGLYNKGTNDSSGVSKYLMIPHEDVSRLEALQVEDEYLDKRPDWLYQKMDWLCNLRGSMYMFADETIKGDWAWRRPDGIRWGTIALGGNLVQVIDTDTFRLKLPGTTKVQDVTMARLQGFMPKDWNRPLDQLLAEGLVHRCYCVYDGNGFGDTPKGIIYSPFWSAECWDLMPKPTKGSPSNQLWIPFDYLETLADREEGIG